MQRILNHRAAWLGAALLVFPWIALAQGPAELVLDFTTSPASSYPRDFVSAGTVAFFTASGPSYSRALWVTDGTTRGTVLLKADGAWQKPAVLRGGDDVSVLFFARNLGGGWDLWKSDGTPAGTVSLVQFGGSVPSAIAVDRGTAYFTANDSVHGTELWRSDGSVEGTTVVSDIAPGAVSGVPSGAADLVIIEGKVFFTAIDPAAETSVDIAALWISDGTAAGTRLVKGGYSYDGFAYHPAFGGRGMYFFAAHHVDGERGRQLWRSDGTEAGTEVIASSDLRLPAPSIFVSEVPPTFELGGSVLFFSNDSLWRTDGTAAGTVPVRGDLTITGATKLADRILFTACDDAFSCGLWRSDGTPAGTHIIADVDVDGTEFTPCSDTGQPMLPYFVNVGSRAYFWAEGGEAGRSLWSSDGTPSGTVVVNGGARHHGPGAALGESILFAADDGNSGTELWISPGIGTSTRLVRNVMPGTQGALSQVARVGNRIAFTAPDEECGSVLASINTRTREVEIASDGGVFDVEPTKSGMVREWLLFVRSNSFFTAVPQGLYSTNGAAAATHLLSRASYTAIWPGRRAAYFGHQKGLYAIEPNGIDVRPVDSEVSVVDVAEFGDHLLFAGQYPTTLWSSDHTLSGSRPVAVFEGSNFVPDSLIASGRRAYFATTEPTPNTITLWRTDGSEAGTVPLHSFPRVGTFDDLPRAFVNLGSDVFFTSKDAEFGRELWRVHGDEVVIVRDVNPGAGDGISSVVATKDRLYFFGDDGIHGFELWSSDGSSEGTRLLRDISPGERSSVALSFNSLAVINNRLIFPADDGESGSELWRSDGTEAGTVRIQDIAPGPPSSRPFDFTAAGPHIYFAADDGLHGRELWRIPTASVGGVCTADCDGNFEVFVDEMIASVNLALNTGSLAECRAADASGDGAVTADEIVQGILNMLGGCS